MKHAAALAAIVGVFALGALWIAPLRDVPIVDDWVYAWSVEHLLETGELRVAAISSVYPIAHIVWGSLFTYVFGFSFGVLRLATATLAAAGCIALYFTLLELGSPPRWSLLGALTLAVHPVYFSLAFSFMTDVPATALSIAALLLAVQSIRRDQPARLWAAEGCVLAAFLIRPTAGLLLLMPVLAIDWRRSDRLRWAAPIAASAAAAPLLWIVLERSFGPLYVASGRLEQLRWLTLVQPQRYLEWNLGLLWESAFPFAPLLLAAAAAPGEWRRSLPAAAILGLILWLAVGRLPAPLADWATWSLQDVGGGRALMGKAPALSAWSIRATPLVTAIGLVTTATLLVALAATVARLSRPIVTVLSLGAISLVAINLFWTYVDRYYLALAPAIGCVAARDAARVKGRTTLAAILIAALWVLSISGTRDMLDLNETAAVARDDLERTGVPPWDIDAGWALNGWRLWAHPEHLAPGVNRRYGVPHVTSAEPTTYLISPSPLPDYDVIRVLPLSHAWWQASDRVYVLRRRAPPIGGSSITTIPTLGAPSITLKPVNEPQTFIDSSICRDRFHRST